jgi:hypothetical protein
MEYHVAGREDIGVDFPGRFWPRMIYVIRFNEIFSLNTTDGPAGQIPAAENE